MSITDELREWMRVHRVLVGGLTELTEIADRIDAEHEKQCAESWMRGHDAWAAIDRSDEMAEHGWIRLPKDADGEYIHVGDWITGRWDAKAKVVAVTSDDVYWWEPDGCHWCHAFEVRHYHEPTVDDVLREMLYKAHIYDEREMELLPDLIAEYASKLRLADYKEQQ